MARSLLVVGSLLLLPPLAHATATEAQVPVFRLSGTVLDANDRPIDGVVARFQPSRGANPQDPATIAYTANSDATGRFEITIDRCEPAGRLMLSKPGFATTLFDRIPSVPPHLALGGLRLLPAVGLTGILTDVGGKPIAQGRVHLLLDPDPTLAAPHSIRSTTSDADGRFSFSNLPPAQITVEIDAPGFETRCETIDLRDPASRDHLVPLRSADLLRGRVVDPSGKPFAGARVARHDECFPALFGELEVATDEKGEFVLPAMRASDPKTTRPYLTVRAPAFPVTRIDFDASSKLRDLVLDAGLPARLSLSEADGSAAEIAAIHYSIFTKAGEGWTHLDGMLKDGDLSTDGTAPAARRFALPKGDRARVFATHRDGRQSNAIELDLHTVVKDGFVLEPKLPARATLSGNVVGPTGQPVAGIRVELGQVGEQSFFPRPERATETDGEGRFTFFDVAPGAWSLRASSESALSDPIPTMIGPTAPAAITLKAARGPRLSGTLKINDALPTLPIGLLALRFQRQGAQGSYIPMASSLVNDGKYEFAALPLGAFAIEPLRVPEAGDGSWHDFKTMLDAVDPRGSKNQITIVEANARTLDVNVRHEALGFVAGSLAINGKARGGVRLAIARQVRLGATPTTAIPSVTDAYGRFRAKLGGPALYRVEVIVGSLRAHHEFEFDPGKGAELALDFPAGAVHGKFDLAAGSPGPFRAVLEGPMSPEEIAIRSASPTNVDDTPWATRAEVLVDAAGNYRFDEIQTGRFRIALEDTSRTLARVASAPFEVGAGQEVAVESVAVGRGGVLEVMIEKPADADRFPFASLKVTSADGAPPLPRTYSGWFVAGAARTDGIPKAKVKVQVILYGPFEVSPPQEIEIDPEGGSTQLTFQVTKKP